MRSEAELAEASERLALATPWEILEWATATFGSKLTMATAFGPEGCVLLHMLSKIGAKIHVFNLDTGYQFPETLRLRDQIAERYGIDVKLVSAEQTVEEYERGRDQPLYRTNPDICCRDRKLAPLRKAVEGYEAWITAIRADQTKDRGSTPLVGWDAKFQLAKINPLLRWTRRDVWAFIVTNKVPYNPLHDHGYPSIGCWPCTKAASIGADGDERSGRWAGQAKVECGLHSLDSSQL